MRDVEDVGLVLGTLTLTTAIGIPSRERRCISLTSKPWEVRSSIIAELSTKTSTPLIRPFRSLSLGEK